MPLPRIRPPLMHEKFYFIVKTGLVRGRQGEKDDTNIYMKRLNIRFNPTIVSLRMNETIQNLFIIEGFTKG